MDDCTGLEQQLTIAKKVLDMLELQGAAHTFLTMPAPFKVDLEEKRKEVADLEARLADVRQPVQSDLVRQSPMRSRVSDKYYIERDAAKKLLENFKIALDQPQEQPLLFNICGIGGVGKTTLLGRLRDAHEGDADFLEVCFTKTADVETPLKLMRKLHQQAAKLLLGDEVSADSFTQQEQQVGMALYALSHQSVDGRTSSSEEAKKITSWFE